MQKSSNTFVYINDGTGWVHTPSIFASILNNISGEYIYDINYPVVYESELPNSVSIEFATYLSEYFFINKPIGAFSKPIDIAFVDSTSLTPLGMAKNCNITSISISASSIPTVRFNTVGDYYTNKSSDLNFTVPQPIAPRAVTTSSMSLDRLNFQFLKTGDTLYQSNMFFWGGPLGFSLYETPFGFPDTIINQGWNPIGITQLSPTNSGSASRYPLKPTEISVEISLSYYERFLIGRKYPVRLFNKCSYNLDFTALKTLKGIIPQWMPQNVSYDEFKSGSHSFILSMKNCQGMNYGLIFDLVKPKEVSEDVDRGIVFSKYKFYGEYKDLDSGGLYAVDFTPMSLN